MQKVQLSFSFRPILSKKSAKAIAYRIKTVLPKMINNGQTRFMKRRLIGENIRLIDGIIQYATQHNVLGLLLFIDFEKAFDSLKWPFIFDTLRFLTLDHHLSIG